MRIIFDGRSLRLYGLGGPGFKGGTEQMVQRIAHGLAERGHTVHVVTPDLTREEQRGPAEWWWGPENFPREADAVVLVQGMQGLEADFQADLLILATTQVNPYCGPNGEWAQGVDAFPVLSQHQLNLMCAHVPTIERRRAFITGLGVDASELPLGVPKVPGRLLYSSEPARGLWHLLDVFEHVRRAESGASLHITYDFDRQFEYHRWTANAVSEALWEAKARIEATPGIVSLGALSREEVRREQAEAEIFAYPCDPVTAGSELFCLAAMEAAAAGAALVLSDREVLPELYGDVATILPLSGTFMPAQERRFDAQDWAEVIVELMQDGEKREAMARQGRELAARHSWDAVIDRWERMLEEAGHGR